MAGGMVQGVECLPSKHKARNLTLSLTWLLSSHKRSVHTTHIKAYFQEVNIAVIS
jgi:hypothetical protein